MNRMLPNPEKAVIVYKLPDSIKDQIDAWWKDGKPPSDLIGSILANQLFPTMMKMDKITGKHLEEVMQYINIELNPECFGSPEKMKAWYLWKKGEEKESLAVVQMREGMDTKRQVVALKQALMHATAVVEEILKAQGDNPHPNLAAIQQKGIFALNDQTEDSLAIKIQ